MTDLRKIKRLENRIAPDGCLLCVIFCLLLVVCFPFPCLAQSDFSLRIAPILQAPLNIQQFNPGFGAALSLDWAFLPFAKKFHMGVSAGGDFTSLAVVTGSSMNLLEAEMELFLRWRPFNRWAFRAGGGAGVYSLGGARDWKILGRGALGAEFYISPSFSLYAEGAYTYRVFATAQPLSTIGAALGMRLNLSEIMGGKTRVQVEKTEQYRVFPVSWAWYEENPVATVKITNGEPNDITGVNLSFFMDSYMSQAWTFADIGRIAPGESVEVPVTALFNEAMLNLIETVNANGTIQVQYRSLGAKKETAFPVQMPIFHRNTFSWDDDRRAAAFVSPRDSSARLFARYVAGAVEGWEEAGGRLSAPKNVRYAAAMFEALRLYGINYVVVPATSFARVQSDESVLDNVSYPYQALYYRGGDCSYLAILFCSLLEALDIETAFITIPGHIYAAFEVGDNNWMAGSGDIIVRDGKRWLPVEITVPGEGFTRAWRIGARQWRNTGAQADLFPIRECWEIYPPVTVPASGDHLPDMPARSGIVKAMETELGR